MTTELEDSSLLIAANNFLASVDFPAPGAPDIATINRLPPPQSAAEIILRDSFETSDVMVSWLHYAKWMFYDPLGHPPLFAPTSLLLAFTIRFMA